MNTFIDNGRSYPQKGAAMTILPLNRDHHLIQRLLELLCLLALLALVTDVFAEEARPEFDTRRLVDEASTFLMQEAAGLGEVHVQVNAPDRAADLPKCAHLEAFLPPGAKAQGKTTVGLHCTTPSKWTVFLQAQVQILSPYLVAAHPLSIGQTLSSTDLMMKLIDITDVPNGVVNNPEGLYGNSLLANIPAGSPIRRQQIKLAYVVRSGQSVKLKLSGQGFEITGEGIAISNASEGQSVQVRTPRGSMVSGIARSGGSVDLRL